MKELELPLGFGMALAQNEAAMQAFEAMPEAEKASMIQRTHSISSKREMQQLVATLGKNGAAAEKME